MLTEQRRYLESLESSSVLTTSILQIGHRGVLEALRAARYTQRAMQSEQRRYLESLESSSVLAKGALLLEQKWRLVPWKQFSTHTARAMQI